MRKADGAAARRPRRLVFVVPFYKPAYIYGGPVRSVSSLCERIAALGHEVRVITTTANGVDDLPAETSVVDGVTVEYHRHRRVRGRGFLAPSLKRAVARAARDADLVYVYGIWNYPAIAAGAACRRVGAPYVVSPRTSLMAWPMSRRGRLRKRAFHALFGKRYLAGARAMHYTTRQEQEEAVALGVTTPGFVVTNPVDLGEFEVLPRRGLFRAARGIAPDAPVVLYLGRVEPRKGIEFALEAFARSASAAASARFVIAGPAADDYRGSLLGLAERLGVAAAVTFTGYLGPEERVHALRDADVFVLTSHAENFAMAAVEAMAAGCAVLLSDAVGVAADVARDDAGRVVPLEPDAIASALRELLGSAALRAELGARARSLAYRSFEPEAIAQRMLDEFESIITTTEGKMRA